MRYTSEERETVCTYDNVTDLWTVYTCVQKHITKLMKIAEPVWIEKEDDRISAARWELSGSQVLFAMKRRYSKEKREKMAELARERFGK